MSAQWAVWLTCITTVALWSYLVGDNRLFKLVEHLYDQDFDRDSNTIEVFVGRLRKKMGIDMIETVRGMGYRMREPEV